MPTPWPWFERKFDFGFPVEKYPDIIERLRGTPARPRPPSTASSGCRTLPTWPPPMPPIAMVSTTLCC